MLCWQSRAVVIVASSDDDSILRADPQRIVQGEIGHSRDRVEPGQARTEQTCHIAGAGRGR